MSIQWFPGHMAKARKEVAAKMKYIDIVFEIVDARLPISSRNPMLDQLIQQKPRLLLLNKGDLADNEQTELWQRQFKEKGYPTLVINAQQNKGINKIVPEAKKALKEKMDRERAKGVKSKAIRAMCVGIPNVGKSTLMNRLVGKKIAQTGNKPGVTRGQQWLKSANDLELLDTPGILWPKFEDKEIGKKLALTGAIKDQLLHLDDLAIYGLTFFTQFYPENLAKRYQLSEEELTLTSTEQLIRVCERLGFREDYNRASERIIQDIRSNLLGPYTLDRLEEFEEIK